MTDTVTTTDIRGTRQGTRPAGRERDRIIAIDLARLLAIIGMIAEHLLLGAGPAAVQLAITGFPSTLFAVLGGVSAVLSTRRYLDEGRPLAATTSLAARGIVVAAVGIALGFLPTFVIVVLVFYGASLIVTSALIRLPSAVLLSIVLALAITGPQLSAAVSHAARLHSIGELSYASPFAFLRSVAFTGTYPLVVWLAYLLAGVLVGRLIVGGMPRARAVVVLAATGGGMLVCAVVADLVSRPAVVAVLSARGLPRPIAEQLASAPAFGSPFGGGWIAVVNAAPHSGSTGDIVRTMGAAMLVIALFMAATSRMRRVPAALRPVQRAGAAPLTIYTAHVLVTSFVLIVLAAGGDDPAAAPWWATGPAAVGLHVAGVLAIGVLLAVLRRRGPLETISSAVARTAARLGGRREAR